MSDPYRLIGYCVIHAGFSKREFEYKFSTTLSNWSEDDKETYFKYHLFNDELNKFIAKKIENATKFPYQNVRLTEKAIYDITQTVESSPSLEYNDMLTEKVSEQEAKIASVNQNIDLLREEMNRYKTEKETSSASVSDDTKNRKSSRLFPIILVAGVIIATLFVVINMGEEPSNHNDVVEDSIANSNLGDSVRFDAKVERFYFHKESETKFLTLTDGKNRIEAVIFSSIKVPFIEEGMNYKFEGVIKDSKTNGEVELHVNKVIE